MRNLMNTALFSELSEEVRSYMFHRLSREATKEIPYIWLTKPYLEKAFPDDDLPEQMPLATYWVGENGATVYMHRTCIEDQRGYWQSFWSFQEFDEALEDRIRQDMNYPPYGKLEKPL